MKKQTYHIEFLILGEGAGGIMGNGTGNFTLAYPDDGFPVFSSQNIEDFKRDVLAKLPPKSHICVTLIQSIV